MSTTFEFSKAKVEKAAKAKERTLEGTVNTENKSALRAVARFLVAQELYPNVPPDDLAGAIVTAFYKDAKFQPSWKAVLEGHAKELLAAMEATLGKPSPRGRRPATVEVTSTSVGQADPDAILGATETADSRPAEALEAAHQSEEAPVEENGEPNAEDFDAPSEEALIE